MKCIAKSLYGLEAVLEDELIALGASDVIRMNRAVSFTGDKELVYRVNYCSRTALSVLVNVSDFRIRSKDDLYNRGLRIDWTKYLDADDTFSVVPVVNSKIFPHTGYPALILKDAIADHFRKRYSRRPSVDTTDPTIVVNLHISNDSVSVSLDSSVVPLFKRGYRTEQSEAPLNEVLAAGILKLSGWDASVPLIDPMCGSGTIPIEAAMIACKIPPGKFRSSYGFRKWKDFEPELLNKVRNDADSEIIKSTVKISGSDLSPEVIEKAGKNVGNAGLSGIVSLGISDFADLDGAGENLLLVMNPPYGERLQPDEILDLYKMIGNTLKRKFTGSSAMIISSHREALKHVGLKPAGKHTLFNGALECLLLRFEMYEGSRKTHSI
jgi:putative N6-adenine-specific DNA methylase